MARKLGRQVDGWKLGRAQTDGQIGVNTSLILQTQYHFRPAFFSCSSENLCDRGETESRKVIMSLRWHHQGAWLCHLPRGMRTDGQKRDAPCSSVLPGGGVLLHLLLAPLLWGLAARHGSECPLPALPVPVFHSSGPFISAWARGQVPRGVMRYRRH